MVLLYMLVHIAASLIGNYNVKMVFCYSTMKFRHSKMYHMYKRDSINHIKMMPW